MVQIAGTYQLEKNENLVEYLISLGSPEDNAKAVDVLKPKIQVAVDGNKISVTRTSGENTSTFILNEEVEELLANDVVLKSTAKIDGDVLTITSKSPDGRITFRIYKFTHNGLTVTMKSDADGPIAKRIYKRV